MTTALGRRAFWGDGHDDTSPAGCASAHTMISSGNSSDPSPAWLQRCWTFIVDHWENPSNTTRHYVHVFVAVLFFFVAQLLTCAWDQPLWKYDIDFPGQIIAMVFVWLFMWAVQLAFYRPGEGLEIVYYRYLKAPVSLIALTILLLLCKRH